MGLICMRGKQNVYIDKESNEQLNMRSNNGDARASSKAPGKFWGRNNGL